VGRAIGGTVVNDCLTCPFHGWKFDASGECRESPGCEHPVKGVSVERYLCAEQNQMVLVWLEGGRDAVRRARAGIPLAPSATVVAAAPSFIAERGAATSPPVESEPEQPKWRVPVEDVVHGGRYQFVGLVQHEIAAHIQEIPENGPDGAHLSTVHQNFVVESLSWLLEHDWDFTWTPGDTPDTKHTAVVGMKLGLRVLGKFVSALLVRVHVTQVGPALVHEYLTLPLGMGDVYFASSVTPVSPLRQRYTHCMWASPNLPRFVAKLLLRGLLAQVNRDVPIWNNKTYRARPPFSKLDANVKRFRAWFANFYGPQSESFAEAMRRERESVLEW